MLYVVPVCSRRVAKLDILRMEPRPRLTEKSICTRSITKCKKTALAALRCWTLGRACQSAQDGIYRLSYSRVDFPGKGKYGTHSRASVVTAASCGRDPWRCVQAPQEPEFQSSLSSLGEHTRIVDALPNQGQRRTKSKGCVTMMLHKPCYVQQEC